MTDPATDAGTVVTFAREAAFSADAIKRAAYRYSDRVSAEITEGAGGLSVRLRALAGNPTTDLHQLADEFRNEVLDQDLRLKVAAETESYRNLILSLAFSKTPLAE